MYEVSTDINEFINNLRNVGDDYLQIRKICQKQIAYYQQENYATTTIKGYLTKIRRRIKQEFSPDHPSLWLPLYDACQNCGISLIPHKQRKNGRCPNPACDTFIQKSFTLPLETMKQLTANREKEVENRAKVQNRIKISASQFISTCENLIDESQQGKSYVKIALTLAACTGRRINSEILASGAFFNPRKNVITFSGQAKNRAKTKPYRIKTFVNARTIYDLWVSLCKMKPYQYDDNDIELIVKYPYKLKSSKEHYKLFQQIDDNLADFRKNAAFRSSKEFTTLVRKYFGYVPGIQTKELRSINALVTSYIDNPNDTSDILKSARKYLGHARLEQTVEYEKYLITN